MSFLSDQKNDKGYIDWEKIGLLVGIPEKHKWHVILMFDTAFKLMEEKNYDNYNGQVESVIFPIIRRIYSVIGIIVRNEEKENNKYNEKLEKVLKVDTSKKVISKKSLGDRLKNYTKDIFYEYEKYLNSGKMYIEDTEENRLTYDVEAENVAYFCDQYILKKL